MVTDIKAGLSTCFDVFFPPYPVSKFHQATLFLRGPSKLDIEAVIIDSFYQFKLTSLQTQGLLAGKYVYEIRVSNDVDTYLADSGRISVEQDITALESYDARTDDEKALEAIRAVLGNRATTDNLKMSFNGRELEKTPIPDLLALERHFIFRVNQARRKEKGGKLFTHHPYRMD